MKRPPQLWLLPTIGILWLSLLHTSNCLRATSLIFAKSTTTTTTEAPTEEPSVASSSQSPADNQTVTKPPLTGIPQIDYIWDPNLPRELNGYNLTDYPFYEYIPKDIEFRCEGLHDGFYASVLHKCQVYHHCLSDIRYDFLCANFTAFDQRTFICHFASEVDCVNSPKYWHRNDALYIPLSTTTQRTTTSQAPATPAPTPYRSSAGNRRRRPLRRRRPQYDYYEDEVDEYETSRGRDDYYDEPRYQVTEPPRGDGRRRRKRPRPTRRPDYEEYEEYEDQRFDRRGSGRRDEERRTYDRRPTKKDPRRDEEDEDRIRDDRRRPAEKMPERKPVETDRRRPVDDDFDRRPYRKPTRRPVDEDRFLDEKEERRPAYDRPRKTDEDDRRYRPKDNKDVIDKDDRRYIPTEAEDKESRRPIDRTRKTEDEVRRYRPKEVKPLEDDNNRRYKPKETKPVERERPIEKPAEEPKGLVRPNSGSSVYDRPRAPPIIRRPVPKNEREKFTYKPMVTTAKPEEEEYYDDYEDELPKSYSPKARKPEVEPPESDRRGSYKYKNQPSSPRKPIVDDIEEPRRPVSKRPSSRPGYETERVASGSKKQRVVQEEPEYDDYEEEKPKPESPSPRIKYIPKERSPAAPRIETTTKETVRENVRPEPVVRVVKRPFLPSRGGNPYVARGLQPVGTKALDSSDKPEPNEPPHIPETPQTDINSNKQSPQVKPASSEEQYEDDIEETKPLPVKIEPISSTEDIIKPITTRPRQDFRTNFRSESPFRTAAETRTTPKSRLDNYRNPLDINENEYDVTLNDALNPTIPNLPIRSVPTGFGSGREGYVAPNYQRSRFIAIDAPLTSSSSDYIYQIKEPQGRLHDANSNTGYNPFVRAQPIKFQGQNYRHPSTAAGQYYTTF